MTFEQALKELKDGKTIKNVDINYKYKIMSNGDICCDDGSSLWMRASFLSWFNILFENWEVLDDKK